MKTNLKENEQKPSTLHSLPPVAKQWLAVIALLLLLPVAGFLTGCQHTAAYQPVDSTPTAASNPLGSTPATPPTSPFTVLNAGDVVEVKFATETNLNTVVKIQLDGNIVMPMVGEVKAAGKTLNDLQADLQKNYQKFIKTTDLTLTVVSTSSCVYVSGAVLRPGRIPLDRPLTAMEAIMEAGGFDLTRAKPSSVSVLRIMNGQQMRYRLDLKAALRDGDVQPFHLQPFDIIHVPEKTFNL